MTREIETDNIIKSILNVHCREGASIADIQSDYEDVTGESLLDAYNRLNSIDCAYCITHPNGESKWFVNSGTKFHHLTKLIMEQNQQKIKPYQRESFRSKPYRPQKQLNHSIGENDCFFKDNIIYKHMRKYKMSPLKWNDDTNNNSFKSHKPKLIESSPPKRSKIALDAQLVGDDFFRTLACDSTIHGLDRKSGVQQVGLCVSGLSIRAAAKLIESTPSFKSNRLIFNIGSADILHGRYLIEMCSDFDHLISVCERRGLQPIITTLAPLANIAHSPEMVNTLRDFNIFLMEKYLIPYNVIDIWSILTNQHGLTKFDCFNTEPNYVSGSNRPHVLWNRNGRAMVQVHIQRFLKAILKKDIVNIDA